MLFKKLNRNIKNLKKFWWSVCLQKCFPAKGKAEKQQDKLVATKIYGGNNRNCQNVWSKIALMLPLLRLFRHQSLAWLLSDAEEKPISMWSTHSCTHWEDVQIQHGTSASCAQACLQPCCLLLWSWSWPLLTEVGWSWVFVQSKAPFSSYKAFMNTRLPPLLIIPLTAALLLPSPSFPPFLFLFLFYKHHAPMSSLPISLLHTH